MTLGRSNETLEEAWAEFQKSPSTYSYEELMRFIPKPERPRWHAKALDAAEGGDLGTFRRRATTP